MENTKRHVCTYENCNSSFNRPYRLAQHILVHENKVSVNENKITIPRFLNLTLLNAFYVAENFYMS